MVLRIAIRKEFSRLPGGLEHFADGNSIPQNQPTIFHPSLIATVQQTFLLLFCVPLFQPYHSSRIDEVSKFDDSMIDLHRICQIPMSYQCKRLSAFLTARETFLNSFPSPEKFWLCTDKTESIEWLDLVPRLRIDDCFEIHLPHCGLCDLLSSSHQTFCSRYCFASASSARSPCHLSKNTVLPGCHFCRTFRIRVMRNVCGCRHFCIFEIFCDLL